MTDAERKLWSRLRNRQLQEHKFVRQLPIGPYIADFACRERSIVIEVDGGQHGVSGRDQRRTEALAAYGYVVLRFWNNEVLNNTDAVLQAIAEYLASPSPDWRYAPATLSPMGRGIGGAPL